MFDYDAHLRDYYTNTNTLISCRTAAQCRGNASLLQNQAVREKAESQDL